MPSFVDIQQVRSWLGFQTFPFSHKSQIGQNYPVGRTTLVMMNSFSRIITSFFMNSQKNPCILVRINIALTSTESNMTQYLHKKQIFTKGKSNVRVVKINFGKSCWLGLWLCLRLLRWEKHKRREFQLLARWHQWWWHQDRVGTGGMSCQEGISQCGTVSRQGKRGYH